MKSKKVGKPHQNRNLIVIQEITSAIRELTLEVRKGTTEMRRYRRMIQNPTIELDDTPGRGIPDGALLETDRARAMAEEE